MRGSDDGFDGKKFLEKCCYKGQTVAIIKDYNEKVFGAYTDINFDGS